MALRQADIAAVVTLHREGESAVPSLVSAWRAAEHARAAGISVLLAIVIDRADPSTVAVANRWSSRGARVLPVGAGDLGDARNAAVRALDSEWVAFLDGDDLWGESWLTRAHYAAASAGDTSLDVWHPQVNVMFGASQSLLHHIDSTDSTFSLARLRLHNAWTALSFVRRSHLDALPYPRNRLDAGFGYEDWSWNIEVLRRGGRHRVVVDAVHAIHRSPMSDTPRNLLARSRVALRSPYPAPTETAAPLPGVTRNVSELTDTDIGLPAQYVREPVSLSGAIYDDLRRLCTLHPSIAATISGPGQPNSLPQNFNRHVTPSQRALEEVELILRGDPAASMGSALHAATIIHDLSADDQHRVVAELLRDPTGAQRDRGESPLIAAALAAYPQLSELLKQVP